MTARVGRLGITGRAVVLTGGSRGLGYSTAERLADEGCNLAICGRDDESLQAAAESLRGRYGVSVHAERADVLEEDALEGFIQRSAQQYGGLNALITCAGGTRGGSLSDSAPRDWLDTYRLNVDHPVNALRAALPYLRETTGSAVLVASISGWKPAPPAQYAAAKAAQIHLTASLARELGSDGVRINAVSPGSMLIAGKGWDRLRKDEPDKYRTFQQEFPAGELVTPEAVAEVIAFLVSDQARAVNGANIPVDGGQNAPSAYGY